MPDNVTDLEARRHRPAITAEADRFFDRAGLLTVQLVEAIEAMGPVGVDHTGKLYRYADGVWQGDGSHVVHQRTYELVGERHRVAHATTAASVFENRPALFGDESHDTQFLNLPNGLLDWKTGELHEHDPGVPSTIRVPVEWDPAATCPQISAWFPQVLPADAIEFAIELLGYCLFNGNPMHKAVMLLGHGRNGKGTYLRLAEALVGTANTCAISPQALDDKRVYAAELYGKLANLVGDVDPRVFKATEIFKMATGEDQIVAERKFGQPFEFTARAVTVAALNQMPRTADTTEGFFSRWLVLPFVGYFPDGKQDKTLEARLHAPGELRGLLVLAVAGLQRLMARGYFDLPASVQEAIGLFRQYADPVRAYLSERTRGERDGWLPRTELYHDYEVWATDSGHAGLAASTFYERVSAASADAFGQPLREAKRNRGARGYVGVAWAEAREAGEAASPPSFPHMGGKKDTTASPASRCLPAVWDGHSKQRRPTKRERALARAWGQQHRADLVCQTVVLTLRGTRKTLLAEHLADLAPSQPVLTEALRLARERGLAEPSGRGWRVPNAWLIANRKP